MDSPWVLYPGIGLTSLRPLCLVRVVKHRKSSGMLRSVQYSAKTPRSALNVETFAANVVVVELVDTLVIYNSNNNNNPNLNFEPNTKYFRSHNNTVYFTAWF